MFGYATDLRSTTQGRATYTMQFERYEEVPPNIAEEIVEHRAGEPVGGRRRDRYIVPGSLAFPGSPARRARLSTDDRPTSKRAAKERDVQGEVRARQAARQRRHDRSHRPRQDDADRRHHEGARREGRRPRRRASTRSTTLPRRRSAGSRSRPRTSSTRPTTATTPTSTAPATPTTSRT